MFINQWLWRWSLYAAHQFSDGKHDNNNVHYHRYMYITIPSARPLGLVMMCVLSSPQTRSFYPTCMYVKKSKGTEESKRECQRTCGTNITQQNDKKGQNKKIGLHHTRNNLKKHKTPERLLEWDKKTEKRHRNTQGNKTKQTNPSLSWVSSPSRVPRAEESGVSLPTRSRKERSIPISSIKSRRTHSGNPSRYRSNS